MGASLPSQTRTRTFARVFGPFLVVVDVVAVVRASQMRAIVAAFEDNPLWSWLAGAFILVFGLIVIAGHQYWRGAAAVTVSLLGWLVALRGLLLLAFPRTFASLADAMIDARAAWVALCTVFALIGVYLTYVGWIPVTDSSPSRTPGPSLTS